MLNDANRGWLDNVLALPAAGAIFVIMEMDTLFDGTIGVSVEPMREALSRLGD